MYGVSQYGMSRFGLNGFEHVEICYNNTKPIVIKVVNYCKTSYNRAFNEGN